MQNFITMRNFLLGSVLLLIATANCIAQPQFSKGGGGSTSGIFLNSTSANRIQEWYNPGDFSPTITSGVITHLWFRNSTANQSGTYANFTLKLAQPSSGTGFSSTTFLTTGFTTVLSGTSQVLTGSTTSGGWWSVQLATPYTYDATKPLVFEIQFASFTGGISTYASAGSGIKKLYTNSSTATTGTDHTTFWQDFGVTMQSCPAPTITVHPSNRDFCPGEPASFAVTATGAQNYRWQVNSGSGFVNLSDNATYSGTTTPGLSITNAPASFAAYQYRCVTTAVCSTSTSSTNSSTALLNLQPAATINAHSVGTTLCEGSSTTLGVNASNAGNYVWQAGNPTTGYFTINDGAHYSGTAGDTLYINNATDSMSGLHYRCIVVGPCNADTTSSIPLTLLSGPSFIDDPEDMAVPLMQNALFYADADGFGQPIQYFWQASYDGVAFATISPNAVYNIGGNALEVMNVTHAQGGMYFRCLVKSANPSCGNIYDTSAAARLIIKDPTDVANVVPEADEGKVEVYPQPTGTTLHFAFWSNHTGNAYMVIKNVSGQTILTQTVEHRQGKTTGDMNVSSLSPGIYFLLCDISQKKSVTKIIKQ